MTVPQAHEPETEAQAKERVLREGSAYLMSQNAGPLLLNFLESQNKIRQIIQPIMETSARMTSVLPQMQTMAAKFGLKNNQIHFHFDPHAQAAAVLLGAKAFAQGTDIYIAEGQGNPDTLAGQELIAHELTHVAQQQGTAAHLANAITGSPEAQAQFMEKQGPALVCKPIEAQSLVQINSIKWKNPKDPKSLNHLMLQKICEGFFRKYLQEELRQDPELAAYLVLHDIKMQSIVMKGIAYAQDPIPQIIQITSQTAKATVRKARQIMEQRQAAPASQPTTLQMKPQPAQFKRAGRVASLGRRYLLEPVARILNMNINTGKALTKKAQTGLKWTGQRTQESLDYLSTQTQSAAQQTLQTSQEAVELAKEGANWTGQKAKESLDYLSTQTQSATRQTAKAGWKAFELTKHGLTATGQWIKGNLIDAKDWLIEFSGFGPDELYDAKKIFSQDKSIVKVDMNLDFFNFFDPSKGIKFYADFSTLTLFALRRWRNSVRLAAPKIANFANNGTFSLIEVPGVNSAGLDEEPEKDERDKLPNLEKIAKKINLPPGKTLVICHSAGTEAGLRSMRLIDPKRRNQVYYLMLSPRMNPKRFAAFMREATIASDHVMTVNSLLDLPHWPDETLKYTSEIAKRPFITWLARFIYGNTPRSWHDYDNTLDTGAHVFLCQNISREFGLSHGSMYKGLSNDDKFKIFLNGKIQDEAITISALAREFINGKIKDSNDENK